MTNKCAEMDCERTIGKEELFCELHDPACSSPLDKPFSSRGEALKAVRSQFSKGEEKK